MKPLNIHSPLTARMPVHSSQIPSSLGMIKSPVKKNKRSSSNQFDSGAVKFSPQGRSDSNHEIYQVKGKNMSPPSGRLNSLASTQITSQQQTQLKFNPEQSCQNYLPQIASVTTKADMEISKHGGQAQQVVGVSSSTVNKYFKFHQDNKARHTEQQFFSPKAKKSSQILAQKVQSSMNEQTNQRFKQLLTQDKEALIAKIISLEGKLKETRKDVQILKNENEILKDSAVKSNKMNHHLTSSLLNQSKSQHFEERNGSVAKDQTGAFYESFYMQDVQAEYNKAKVQAESLQRRQHQNDHVSKSLKLENQKLLSTVKRYRKIVQDMVVSQSPQKDQPQINFNASKGKTKSPELDESSQISNRSEILSPNGGSGALKQKTFKNQKSFNNSLERTAEYSMSPNDMTKYEKLVVALDNLVKTESFFDTLIIVMQEIQNIIGTQHVQIYINDDFIVKHLLTKYIKVKKRNFRKIIIDKRPFDAMRLTNYEIEPFFANFSQLGRGLILKEKQVLSSQPIDRNSQLAIPLIGSEGELHMVIHVSMPQIKTTEVAQNFGGSLKPAQGGGQILHQSTLKVPGQDSLFPRRTSSMSRTSVPGSRGLGTNDENVLKLIGQFVLIKLQCAFIHNDMQIKNQEQADILQIVGDVCRQRTHATLAKTIRDKLPQFLGFDHVGIIFSDKADFFTIPQEAVEQKRQEQKAKGELPVDIDDTDIYIRFPKTLGITGQVFQNMNTFMVNDMGKAQKYNPDVDNFSGIGYVKNLMIGCLQDETGVPVGVLQFLNKSSKFPINKYDEARFKAAQTFLGTAMYNMTEIKKTVSLTIQAKDTVDILTRKMGLDDPCSTQNKSNEIMDTYYRFQKSLGVIREHASTYCLSSLAGTSSLLLNLSGHDDRVWQLAWHPNGNLLASCSSDKTIRLWSIDNNQINCRVSPNTTITELQAILEGGHTKTIRSIAWSPCGSYLASGSFDGTTSIWNKTGDEYECVSTLEGHDNEVKSVSWSSDGKYLATCSRDKTIWIWETSDDFEYECLSVLPGHAQDVKMVKWHPSEPTLYSCSYDDTIKQWKYSDAQDDWINTATLTGHESTIWGIDFDSTGKYLMSCAEDMYWMIWDLETMKNKGRVQGPHCRAIFTCAWKDSFVVTGGGDNRICLYEINMTSLKDQDEDQEGKNFEFCLHADKVAAHENDVNCVTFNPKTMLIASCSDDKVIKIWQQVQ